MAKIKIHFYKGNHLFSWLIKLRTYSIYSHVSIQIDDKIYEAVEGKGVICSVPRKDPPASLVFTKEIKISKEQLEIGEKWLKSQLGKKYDYCGILLFIGLPRPYSIDNKWFCSELASVFLWKIGYINKPKMLLSPGALYLLISNLLGTSLK